MSVKIRFARFGLKHQPRYRIVVANSFAKRDGRNIEWIGSFNPFPDAANAKLCQLNFERARYWLGVGAQPTEPVQRLFSKAGLLPSIPRGSLLLDKESGSGSE